MPRRAVLLLAVLTVGCSAGLRPFADRPVAWAEHDDEDIPMPDEGGAGASRVAIGMVDLLIREVDRALSIEWRRPADDINALDEVPCSTWFCARNHLDTRLTPDAVAAGPRAAVPPILPLTIKRGNEDGAERGFLVVDAADRPFRLKFDPPGHAGLATGAQAVAQRLFWAAGYNTPGAWVVEISPGDLVIASDATTVHHGYQVEQFTPAVLVSVLGDVAVTADGKVRAVAVAEPIGTPVGTFGFTGTRDDDPNDRIPHQHRRALRASQVLAAWIGAAAMSSADTQDVWVDEGGRRFIRHFFVNFSSSFGASWVNPKGPWLGQEQIFDLSRIVKALVLLGGYRRDWQEDRDSWTAVMRDVPALGWFQAQNFRPNEFRTVFPLPAFVRMTDRDAYWGAKVVTSFSDAQIKAAVSAGKYSTSDAALLEWALRARRDAIGRFWLTRSTAIEGVTISKSGRMLCARDLAIERGATVHTRVRYHIVAGGEHHWYHARGARSCLPLPAPKGDYAVIMVAARIGGVLARAARVHAAWRAGEKRWVVVGIERDE